MGDVTRTAGITAWRHGATSESEQDAKFRGLRLRVGVLGMVVGGNKVEGEHNLHAHPDTDTVWFVLSGKVRFYGADDVLIGEIGPNEGVAVPKGVPYRYENAGDGPHQICHITARDLSAKDTHRVDYSPYTEGQKARRARPDYNNKSARPATEEDRRIASAL